jgi:CheY-like chemotaxis protein
MPTRIVVVHDEPSFVDELVAALSSMGHQVAAFTNPLEAWDALAAAEKTEVLITCVHFPPGKSNGLALAHMAHLNRPSIHVIFLALPEFARDCEDDGTFLPLPVSALHVAKTVELLLQRSIDSAGKTAGAAPNLWDRAMDTFPSNRRSDAHLAAILGETGRWAVNGRQGRVLGYAGSLRQAIDRSVKFSASGAAVIAICRLPSDNIIVFSEQIDRLRRHIEARELIPAK